MKFIELHLPGAFLIEVEKLVDHRGAFFRTFCKDDFKQINHDKEFIQFNHSINNRKGTIRGMHYQIPPDAEVKLIRCIKGHVHDVLVDLRKNSSTFLNWITVELSAGRSNMIYVPEGIAHGFQTLEDNCELLYYHTSAYNPMAERGVRYDDSKVDIKWPIDPINISDRDKSYPMLTPDFKGI